MAAKKKLAYVMMGSLLVYTLVRSVVAAEGKILWYDELLTVVVSGQGTWKAIVGALLHAVDGQPPLFHWIEHLVSGLVKTQEIALRLPSVLALECTLICVFLYVKKLSGEVVALLCTMFILTSSVYQYYAVEARPYSMVVACIAFALVCYQRLPTVMWTVLLALSLALAESLHYMAVLAMIPFGLAEAVVSLRAKKFRWQVWAALAAGALPLVIFWKFPAVMKTYYGANYYLHTQFSELPTMYGGFFMTDRNFGAGIAAAAIVAVFASRLRWQGVDGDNAEERVSDVAEKVLLVAMTALPLLGYLLIVRGAHTGITGRYVLSAVVGVASAFGYSLSRVSRRALMVLTAFVLTAVAVNELHFWRFIQSDIQDVRFAGRKTEQMLASAGHSELPVVVPDSMLLLKLLHYVSAPFATRFVYLLEDHAPNDKDWETTEIKQFLAFRPYVNVSSGNYAAFAREHSEFLVYVEEKDWYGNWVTARSEREGWTVRTVASEEYRKVYLVKANGGKPVEK
jgi:hypothetical protein